MALFLRIAAATFASLSALQVVFADLSRGAVLMALAFICWAILELMDYRDGR